MVQDVHSRPDPPGPPADWEDLDPRRWLGLSLVLVAGFMDLLDATIVNVAIPSIQRDLDAQYASIEWMVSAYLLAFASVLITGGRLGDIVGRKRMFLIGVLGFTVASTLCGIAPTPGVLIASRFLQGAMAALMVPQILAIIHVTFPPEERGKVFGLFGGIIGSAAVAGPILGGILVEANLWGLQWRPIFLVNIPVGVIVSILAWRVLRESKSPTAAKLDLLGVVLVTAAVLLVIYPLTEGRANGWPLWGYLMMVSAIPVLAVFIVYERRRTATVGSPLVVLRLFKARAFDGGLLVWLLFQVALGAFFFVWTLYMQFGLGWTALHAGLTAVSFALGASPAAGISIQVLTPKFGRKVVMAGALLNAAGFGAYIWAIHHYGTDITSWEMVPPLVLSGFGFGLVVAPITDIVLSGVPTRDAGSASGLFNTTQQLGAALGIALVGVLMFHLIAQQADGSVDEVEPKLRADLAAVQVTGQQQDALVQGFRTCVSDRANATDPSATPESCRQPVMGAPNPQAAQQVAKVLTDNGTEANAKDFSKSFTIGLGYLIGALIICFLGMFTLPRRATYDSTMADT
ncbi:MFS transporter [Actinomadura sp. NEAU-AAG7]|uniref:MFS transporter n=1 Tax=Actinomadura sp. NEAU-AAG7 TaxID=2839640 RepID=UPI0027DF4139|nr:MFS transporter [Actinomadura sp. NEAU-AAG7]